MGKRHRSVYEAPVNICLLCGGNLKRRKMLDVETYVCIDCGEVFDIDDMGLIPSDSNNQDSTVLQMEWLIQKNSRLKLNKP